MRAASALTLQKPCHSKKLNDLNAVAVLPGSGTQTLLDQRETMTRQILPLGPKK